MQLAGKHVVISNNTFMKCGLSDFYSYTSCKIYNNTVNGKSLVYMEEESNRSIENAGQVFLINCTISNAWVGIRLSKWARPDLNRSLRLPKPEG